MPLDWQTPLGINMKIINAEKIKDLLIQLSSNPEDYSLAEEIMQLIKRE